MSTPGQKPEGVSATEVHGRAVQAPAEAIGRFVVAEGKNRGAALALLRAQGTVGRHPTNDLVLEDPRVSAVHLELTRRPAGHVLVRDAGSTNGTWIGDHRVLEVELAPGAIVRVGDTLLRLEADVGVTPAQARSGGSIRGSLGSTAAMRELFAVLDRVSSKPLSVLVQGDTGTGKEEVARAIHARSARAKAPFTVLDATTIPATLAESVLFGHERGAFTGADARYQGAFERAHGGTLFIDEVGELPLALQPKLLRVLEQRELTRVGGKELVPIDVRVVSATHRDLAARNRSRSIPRRPLLPSGPSAGHAAPASRASPRIFPSSRATFSSAPRSPARSRWRSTPTRSPISVGGPFPATCASCATSSFARLRSAKTGASICVTWLAKATDFVGARPSEVRSTLPVRSPRRRGARSSASSGLPRSAHAAMRRQPVARVA